MSEDSELLSGATANYQNPDINFKENIIMGSQYSLFSVGWLFNHNDYEGPEIFLL